MQRHSWQNFALKIKYTVKLFLDGRKLVLISARDIKGYLTASKKKSLYSNILHGQLICVLIV